MSVLQSRTSLPEPYAPVWSGPVGATAMPHSPTSHPAFERMLKRLPEEHRRALTDEQLHALALASIPSPPKHKVEYRVSLPFFGKRYYVTFLFGREQRSRARLVAEGQMPAAQIVKPDPVAWTLILSLAGFGILLSLFIAKAMLGIDFLDDVQLHDVMQHLTDVDVRPSP